MCLLGKHDFFKFARAGGPIQDLFDFRLFSLHLAAPKTTRLLLPAYVDMKSYVDSSTLTRPQNNDFRGQASSPCSLSRRPHSRKLDFHQKSWPDRQKTKYDSAIKSRFDWKCL